MNNLCLTMGRIDRMIGELSGREQEIAENNKVNIRAEISLNHRRRAGMSLEGRILEAERIQIEFEVACNRLTDYVNSGQMTADAMVESTIFINQFLKETEHGI